MFSTILRTTFASTLLPILVVASLPFATASCAIFETLRPSITAAGHILLDGLDELLTQLENPPAGRIPRQQLTDDIIVKLEICAETVPLRYLEPYRARFRAALRTAPLSEGEPTTGPG